MDFETDRNLGDQKGIFEDPFKWLKDFSQKTANIQEKGSLKSGKHDSERHLYFCTASTVNNFIF